jgi:hypothetical protein
MITAEDAEENKNQLDFSVFCVSVPLWQILT